MILALLLLLALTAKQKKVSILGINVNTTSISSRVCISNRAFTTSGNFNDLSYIT